MNTTTLYAHADAAIRAYDAFVFAAVGRQVQNFDERADTLAAVAWASCDAAAKDRTVNAFTRKFYRELAAEFHAIAA